MNIYTDRFFTLSPYLLGVMGFDGYFKCLNSAWEKTLGWTVAELQARPYLEFVHPEDRVGFIDTAHQLMAGGATTSVQSRYLCQDGSSKWLAWDLTAFPEEQLIYTVVHDISQHQQVMNTLRDNRDHFWLLAENLQDLIYRYRFSPGRGFEYVSPTTALITGYTPEEYYADPDLYFKIIHPDDRPQLERHFQEKSLNGQPLTLRWVRKDGTIIWIEQRHVPIFDQAGYLMVVEGIARNITKCKQVEEALQESNRQLEIQDRFISRILESIPLSLVVIDRSLHLVSANRNFLEKTRREAAATLGRRLQEVFPPVLLEYTRLEWRIQQVFRTGQLMEGGKVAYRAAGLSPRIYYYRLIPLKAEETVENVMLLLDDITDREQLSEEVRRAERR
ncbi:MAG: PAS domain-containing protein [Chloroflexi bacterium]|nr:PAS domain-containing protein [Chloroflexota bacterium]